MSPQDRCLATLDNLRVGDAFGEQFFFVERWNPNGRVTAQLPPGPWSWTDDTAMAVCIAEELRTQGDIDADRLARSFADAYGRAPNRGYGGGAHEILSGILAGQSWRALAGNVFDGQGSKGNGSAMRIGPLGAYFADDTERLIAAARRSCAPTHAHPEAEAGAIAVALATAGVWRGLTADALLDEVLGCVPAGAVAEGLAQVRQLGGQASPRAVVDTVGNGSRVLCEDTVPYCLWVAAYRAPTFESAMQLTVAAGGDMDTTCAIVASIMTGHCRAPEAWRARAEPGPDWRDLGRPRLP